MQYVRNQRVTITDLNMAAMLLIYDRVIAVIILGRERRPEVDNVIDSVGACEPKTAVAG